MLVLQVVLDIMCGGSEVVVVRWQWCRLFVGGLQNDGGSGNGGGGDGDGSVFLLEGLTFLTYQIVNM